MAVNQQEVLKPRHFPDLRHLKPEVQRKLVIALFGVATLGVAGTAGYVLASESPTIAPSLPIPPSKGTPTNTPHEIFLPIVVNGPTEGPTTLPSSEPSTNLPTPPEPTGTPAPTNTETPTDIPTQEPPPTNTPTPPDTSTSPPTETPTPSVTATVTRRINTATRLPTPGELNLNEVIQIIQNQIGYFDTDHPLFKFNSFETSTKANISVAVDGPNGFPKDLADKLISYLDFMLNSQEIKDTVNNTNVKFIVMDTTYLKNKNYASSIQVFTDDAGRHIWVLRFRGDLLADITQHPENYGDKNYPGPNGSLGIVSMEIGHEIARAEAGKNNNNPGNAANKVLVFSNESKIKNALDKLSMSESDRNGMNFVFYDVDSPILTHSVTPLQFAADVKRIQQQLNNPANQELGEVVDGTVKPSYTLILPTLPFTPLKTPKGIEV